MKRTLKLRAEIYTIERPLVMGILNLTPDSFYSQSRVKGHEALLEKAAAMIESGADILDLGGQSTRPGAKDVGLQEELDRLLPALAALRSAFPEVYISADTYRAEVARQAASAGADLINDISGGTMDADMFPTMADLQIPYVLMHIQGTPSNMQDNPHYENVTGEVFAWLKERCDTLFQLGVYDIIIDPGFGFGKTLEHNYRLLTEMSQLRALGYPILAGLSRKSMINRLLGITQDQALPGTMVLNTIALQQGANILRVHDVEEAVQCVRILAYIDEIRRNQIPLL